MTTLIFDTLQFTKKAKAAGFTEVQAEFQAEEIARIIDNNLATKSDIQKLESDMSSLKKDIIIAVGKMLIAAVFVLPILFKLINLI